MDPLVTHAKSTWQILMQTFYNYFITFYNYLKRIFLTSVTPKSIIVRATRVGDVNFTLYKCKSQ
jgi:hypothetical protein